MTDMSETARVAEPRFKASYPEAAGATLSWKFQYDAGGPSSMLTLPDYYIQPGDRLVVEMDSTGRINVELLGVE